MRPTTEPPVVWAGHQRLRTVEVSETIHALALRMTEVADPIEVDELWAAIEEHLAKLLVDSGPREREFKKAILLLFSVCQAYLSADLTREAIRGVASVTGRLRLPRLTELDLADFRRTLLTSGLNPNRGAYRSDGDIPS